MHDFLIHLKLINKSNLLSIPIVMHIVFLWSTSENTSTVEYIYNDTQSQKHLLTSITKSVNVNLHMHIKLPPVNLFLSVVGNKVLENTW